ncbi:MAG: hypothetical protein ACXIUP_07570 [Microcella sp.]
MTDTDDTLPDHELVRRAKAILCIRHSADEVAERLGVALLTLRQYAVEPGKAAHRRIGGFRLEELLEMARMEMHELGMHMQTSSTSTEQLVISAASDIGLARHRAGMALEKAEGMLAIPQCPEYRYREVEHDVADRLKDSVESIYFTACIGPTILKEARERQALEEEAELRGEEFIE